MAGLAGALQNGSHILAECNSGGLRRLIGIRAKCRGLRYARDGYCEKDRKAHAHSALQEWRDFTMEASFSNHLPSSIHLYLTMGSRHTNTTVKAPIAPPPLLLGATRQRGLNAGDCRCLLPASSPSGVKI